MTTETTQPMPMADSEKQSKRKRKREQQKANKENDVKKAKQSAITDVASKLEESVEEPAKEPAEAQAEITPNNSKQLDSQQKQEQPKTSKQNDVKKVVKSFSENDLEKPKAPAEKPVEAAVVDAQQSKRKRRREQQKANKQADTKKAKQPADDGLSKKPEKTEKPVSKAKGTKVESGKPTEPKKPAKPERISDSIAMMDAKLIADFVSQKLRRFEKDMSAVELEDSFIPEKSFGNTTEFEQPRSLENLSSFLQKFHTLGPSKEHYELNRTPENTGSPHTIIVAAAALRATDLVRAVKTFQTKENVIAKLFAKHIKLKDATDMCQSTKMGIAVGTPRRIVDLVKEEALQLQALERIVIDASALNDKNQGIFDIRETYSALMEFLNYLPVKERLGEQAIILLY